MCSLFLNLILSFLHFFPPFPVCVVRYHEYFLLKGMNNQDLSHCNSPIPLKQASSWTILSFCRFGFQLQICLPLPFSLSCFCLAFSSLLLREFPYLDSFLKLFPFETNYNSWTWCNPFYVERAVFSMVTFWVCVTRTDLSFIIKSLNGFPYIFILRTLWSVW